MEKIRLLLVDDEDDFRRTVSKRLMKRGIEALQAGSGEECLALLERNPVDVVVLDVKMRGIDGIETLHRIKEKHPKIEVIMLTGFSSAEDGVNGIKTGAFDYLSKPIELDHLLSKIKQAHEKIQREDERLRETAFRAKMEQQMIATERLASLGTLAAGVAHEINNPLAIIKESAGWMQLILNKEEMADTPRKDDLLMALSKIENGVERARRITHQLLGSVRQADSVASEVDLKDLVKETVGLVGKELRNKEVEIVLEVDPDTGVIWSDPYKLRQVLINLITNAIHATGSGGKITVGVLPVDEKVAITIQDTGEGIPRENLQKIFDPFFSTKPPGEGTGLGLFVTRSIVEKLGGDLSVESRLGQGTRFLIHIPRCQSVDEAPTGKNHLNALKKAFET